MMQRPTEFIWCGVYFIKGKSDPAVASSDFYTTLGDMMLLYSNLKAKKGYTFDVIIEGLDLPFQDYTDGTMRARESYCNLREVECGDVFLKPAYDSLGPTFIQVVSGSKEFLRASAYNLLPEYGWPKVLGDDAVSSICELTHRTCVVGFIRPKMPEPFFLNAATLQAENKKVADYRH